METRLRLVSLPAGEVPAAAHFYRDVLGLRLLPHHGGRPHFDLGGIYLTLVQATPAPARGPELDRFPALAFAVDDLDAAVEQLLAHAVELPWGVESGGGSRWVMFRDPAGNLVELAESQAFHAEGPA